MTLLAIRFLTRVNRRITSATDLFTNVPAVQTRISSMHTPKRFFNQSRVMSPSKGQAGASPAHTAVRALTSSLIVLSSISIARVTAAAMTVPGLATPNGVRFAQVPYTLLIVNGLVVISVGMLWLSHVRGVSGVSPKYAPAK